MKRFLQNPPATPWVRTAEPLLWLTGAGHEMVAPGETYWRDARSRNDPHFVIQLTLRGAAFYERANQRTLLTPGMAFIEEMPGDFMYGYPPDAHEAYEQVWVDLAGPTALPIFEALRGTNGPVVSFGAPNPLAPLMLALAREHASGLHFDRYLLSSQLYHLLMTAWSSLNSARLEVSPLAASTLEIIRQSGLDEKYNVESIAEQLGCSREHLTRTFRKATGVGPGDYLMQHRLRAAARQLLESREKLDLIAKRCGFSGANYFCRAFRRHMGMTPNEYRKR